LLGQFELRLRGAPEGLVAVLDGAEGGNAEVAGILDDERIAGNERQVDPAAGGLALEQNEIEAAGKDALPTSRKDEQDARRARPAQFVAHGVDVVVGFELDDLLFHGWFRRLTAF